MGGVSIEGATQPAPDQPTGDSPVPADAVAYYYAHPAPTAPFPPERRRRRRALLAVCAAWLLVLLGTGTWYSFRGQPTVREQTSIAQARPVVDSAAGWVLRAAGAQPVAELGAYAKAGDCDITPVRGGEEWVRGLRLATVVGGEESLLRQIAAGLPHGYAARVHPGPVPSLYADAGDYVAVRGAIEAPGLIHVQITTGCRSVGHRPAADPTVASAGAERTAVEAALAALGASATQWATDELSCAGAGGAAGTVRTVTATVPDTTVGALDQDTAPAGTPLVAGEHVRAVRDGNVGTLVRNSGGTLTVSATTGTCA
jgi:hypothetical protein